MKRYILLIGERYFPAGWSDFAGSFDTRSEALSVIANKRGANCPDADMWFELIDCETEKIIMEGEILGQREIKRLKNEGKKRAKAILDKRKCSKMKVLFEVGGLKVVAMQ